MQEARLLAELVARRRQIIEMIVAERKREKRADERRASARASPARSRRSRRSWPRSTAEIDASRARLASMAREGGPAGLCSGRGATPCPHLPRRTARTRRTQSASRSQASPGSPRSPASPANGRARAMIGGGRAKPRAAPLPGRSVGLPSQSASSRPSSTPRRPPASPKWSPSSPSPARLLTILNAILRDKKPWQHRLTANTVAEERAKRVSKDERPGWWPSTLRDARKECAPPATMAMPLRGGDGVECLPAAPSHVIPGRAKHEPGIHRAALLVVE